MKKAYSKSDLTKKAAEVFKNLSVYKLNEKVSTKILLNTGSGYDGEVTYKVNDRFRYLTPIEKMMIN